MFTCRHHNSRATVGPAGSCGLQPRPCPAQLPGWRTWLAKQTHSTAQRARQQLPSRRLGCATGEPKRSAPLEAPR